MPRQLYALTEPMTAGERAANKAERAEWKKLEDRIAELEAALGKALSYCDDATHQDNQYADERGELIRVWRNE